MREQSAILQTSVCSSSQEFQHGVQVYNTRIQAAEAALGPLAVANRLMKKDMSYSRFRAGDFKRMHELTTRLTVRANGMAFYFKIMDPSRHRFTGNISGSCTPTFTFTPTPSRPSSKPASRACSPPSTPKSDYPRSSQMGSKTQGDLTVPRRRRVYNGLYHYFQSHHNLPGLLGNSHSLFRDIRVRGHDSEHAVGVFESQAYLNLESRFEHANADVLLDNMMSLLGSSTNALLVRCSDTLDHATKWLQRVNDDRLWKRVIKRRQIRKWQDVVEENEGIRDSLKKCLEEFRSVRRLVNYTNYYAAALNVRRQASSSRLIPISCRGQAFHDSRCRRSPTSPISLSMLSFSVPPYSFC